MLTAGTAVVCTTALTKYPISAVNKLCNRLVIQPKNSNGGIGFVGGSNLDPTTDVGIVRQFSVPTPTNIETFEDTEIESPNGINLGDYYVASTQDGDVFYFGFSER